MASASEDVRCEAEYGRKDIGKFGSGPFRLTTSRGAGATVSCFFALATFTRTALRAAALQDQVQVFAARCNFSNWILRDDTAIIFDIYIQVRTRNHAISEP